MSFVRAGWWCLPVNLWEGGVFPGPWSVCVCEHAQCSLTARRRPKQQGAWFPEVFQPVQVGLNPALVSMGKSLPMRFSFLMCKVEITTAFGC